jgi:hypothetical protein
MNIENLLQLGFAGAIAIYLVAFLVQDVKKSQSKILETLEKITDILRNRNGNN